MLSIEEQIKVELEDERSLGKRAVAWRKRQAVEMAKIHLLYRRMKRRLDGLHRMDKARASIIGD